MIDLILHVVNDYIQAHKAVIGLVILAILFTGFIMERFPAAVVAVLGACSFLFLGIINSDGLFSVFSNTAPITIAAMFILSGALLRTGTIDAVASFIIKRARNPSAPRCSGNVSRRLRRFRFHEQHPGGHRPHPDHHPPVAGHRNIIEKAADPAELHLHIGRHNHSDRHVHQPDRRRGCARHRTGRVRDIRD